MSNLNSTYPSLHDKTVVITGASRGLGATFAKKFAQCGSFVGINYRIKKDKAEELLSWIRSEGGQGMLIPFDITKIDEVKEGLEDVISERGSIDVLINNAGIVSDSYFALMNSQQWGKVIDTNVHGAFNVIHTALPYMISQKAGVMLNIASVAGLHASPGQANYAASKGAIISLTRTLAAELAPKGIRVNTVVPGLISSGMTTRLNRDIAEQKKELIPMGRFGNSDEVADAVLFLASDNASYITGQSLIVDGGLTI
jgi:3-oxoacyl-[acyl-carrier protein] reductase